MSVSGLAQKLASLFRPTANGTGDGEKTHSHVEEPRYIQFHHLEHDAVNEDGTPKLNKFSSTLTNNHDFPGAQVGRSLGARIRYDTEMTILTTRLGYALRCWCAKRGSHEKGSSNWRSNSLVGRKPLQVSLPYPSSFFTLLMTT